MDTLYTTLQNLSIGEPQTFRNLTAFPLTLPEVSIPGYVTLATGIQNKTVSITEISDGGSVPELLLTNTGDEPVLILDGEELLGAKQNRIANLTILAAAQSKTVIPVSCVEQGRWSRRSEEFDVSERAQFSRGRAAKAASLSANMKSTGTYGANQGEVWDHIEAKQVRMQVESPTAAMADMYDQHHEHVEDYASRFTPVLNQVGVMFAIDAQVEGMDLFDAPDTLTTMLPKLVRSFAIDALESADDGDKQAKQKAAELFLNRIAAAHIDSYPGVGLGTDIRLSAPRVAGGGLVHEDRLIHLAAFGVNAPRAENGAPGESVNETRLRAQRYRIMRRRNQNH